MYVGCESTERGSSVAHALHSTQRGSQFQTRSDEQVFEGPELNWQQRRNQDRIKGASPDGGTKRTLRSRKDFFTSAKK